MCLFNLQMVCPLLLVLDYMGSVATGIPIGAPVTASPLENSVISLCLELENDARSGDE